MKETTPAAMPPCFDRWCKRFDDIFSHQAQKREFRNYIGGLLGESERKNLSQMASNAVGVTYHRLHHFLTEAPWSAPEVNERRLQVMNKCSQTKISRGFTLILDDSGHRKSGNFTEGVGRQYIGEIGKTENGIVVVTTHLYDGSKSLPLDIELYQQASSLPEGKKDFEFKKKPELGLALIDRSLDRGYRPGIVLIDAGYGNNTTFLLELEKRKLKYKGWLGLKEYQVRDKRSLMRHFILVFCAYTFILWHTLTGGLRRRWASKPLNTFPEALEAFRTAMSFRFIEWLNHNRDVFLAYKASLGFVWA
jgi:SRSO17 transposase